MIFVSKFTKLRSSKQISPSKINEKYRSSRVCGVIGILPSLFNTVVGLSFYNAACVKCRARALHDWSHRHRGSFFFSPLFRRFSFASQPMSRGTENKIRRRNTYIRYVTAETRWHKGGETGFQSLHLILRRRRRRRSPHRRRGRRAIADLTTRYHECSRRSAISRLMVGLPRVSTPTSIILSMADVVLRSDKTTRE